MEDYVTQQEFSESLHKALRLLRESRRLSQAELARRLGVDRATMNRYEAGSIRPGVERLAQILEVLKVSWSGFGEALDEVRRAEAEGHALSPESLFLETSTPDDDLIAAYLAAASRGKGHEFVDAAIRKTRHLVRWREHMKKFEGDEPPSVSDDLEDAESDDPARLEDFGDAEVAEPGR